MKILGQKILNKDRRFLVRKVYFTNQRLIFNKKKVIDGIVQFRFKVKKSAIFASESR